MVLTRPRIPSFYIFVTFFLILVAYRVCRAADTSTISKILFFEEMLEIIASFVSLNVNSIYPRYSKQSSSFWSRYRRVQCFRKIRPERVEFCSTFFISVERYFERLHYIGVVSYDGKILLHDVVKMRRPDSECLRFFLKLKFSKFRKTEIYQVLKKYYSIFLMSSE